MMTTGDRHGEPWMSRSSVLRAAHYAFWPLLVIPFLIGLATDNGAWFAIWFFLVNAHTWRFSPRGMPTWLGPSVGPSVGRRGTTFSLATASSAACLPSCSGGLWSDRF